MTFKRIRNLREDNDLRQWQLAEYLKVTQVAYSRYELGQRIIPPEMLIKLARFYGVSVDYLVGETDVKEPYPKSRNSR